MYLKSLRVSNYTSFGENINIEFDSKFFSTLLLGRNLDSIGMYSNGAGKSNFASAPLWCMFGIPINTGSTADDVIRTGCNECSVEIVIIDDVNTIRIKRLRKLNGNNLLEFYINNNLVNEKITSPTDVQESINEYFDLKGTPKQIINDFISTNFLSYNSVEMLINKTYSGTDRFDFISRIFGLDKWMECKEVAAKKASELLKDILPIESKIELLQKEYDESDIEFLESATTELEEDYSSTTEWIKSLEEERIKAEKVRDISDRFDEKKITLNELINKLEETKRTYNQKLTNVKTELGYLDGTLLELNKRIKALPLTKEGGVEELNDLVYQNSEEMKGIYEVNSNISLYKSELTKLYEMRTTALSCPNCKEELLYINNSLERFNNESINEEITKKKELLETSENNLINKEKAYNVIQEKVSKITNDLDIVRQFDELDMKIGYSVSKKKLLSNRVTELETEYVNRLNEINTEIIKYESEISSITILLNKLDVKMSVTEINQKLLIAKTNLDEVITKKAAYQSMKTRTYKIKSEIEILKKEINNSSKKYESFKYWAKGFPEIRRMIIQSLLPEIETKSNEYLEEMGTPFQIELNTFKETKSNTIKEEFNIQVLDKITGETFPIHMRSTGERKRIGVSVCFALQSIKASRIKKIFDFRFFDEFLDNLDATGVDFFLKLLDKEQGQNFVISHNDELKNRFHRHIGIIKSGGISDIRYS